MADPPRDPITQQLLELMLAQAQDHALVLLDSDERIHAWLAGSERIYGYRAEEVLGKHVSILFTPEDRATNMPELERRVAVEAHEAEDDRWMLRKDGLRIWVTGVMSALRDERGNVVGFSKVMRNRSDLRAQFERLESGLAAAQEKNDRKNVFITTLAHELRNPLASLAQAAELIREGRAQDVTFALSVIQRQVGFMQRMIDDLLEVTRVQVGKAQLMRSPVVLQEVLQAAVETCRASIDEREHNLQLIMPGTAVQVEGDASRLQQVFVNLVQNAAKYTGHGGNIWVKLYLEADEAVARIEDTGIGISAEMLPRIFELFTQAEPVPGNNSQGLGIGLALVKNLVDLHGGTIQVRSDGLGAGSKFIVRLPLAPDQAASRPDRP